MKQFQILFLLLISSILVSAQGDRRPITHEDIIKWNRITETHVSNNGEYIVYKLEPWKGDPILKVSDSKGKELASFIVGTDAQITSDSKHLVFTQKPRVDSIRNLKLKKTKKEDLPQNKLVVYNLKRNKSEFFDNVKSLKVPTEWSGWIAWQMESVKDTTTKQNPKDSEENVFSLFVKNLKNGDVKEFPAVSDYKFAQENKVLSFISKGKDSTFEAGVYVNNLKETSVLNISNSNLDHKQLTINKTGDKIAFLRAKNEDKEKTYSLFAWHNSGKASEIVTNTCTEIPENWEISENGKLSFSDNGKRLFFGTAPIKTKKDTTILEEEIPVLDVWHWNEEILQTVQLNNKAKDEKKAYLAKVDLDNRKAVQLETKKYSGIRKIKNGDADKAIAWSNRPYAVQSMWEGSPTHNDFYLVDLNTGQEKLIKKDCRATPMVSTNGKYMFWYNALDTSWNTYNIETEKEYKLTTPDQIYIANELNDRPNLPSSYRYAGWIENDKAFLVYDRYDIWKLDPRNEKEAVNLTKSGRESKTSYRLINFDSKDINYKGINIDRPLFLTAHNEITRADSYHKFDFNNPGETEILLEGTFKLNTPIKSKNEATIVFTKEDFETYPNLLVSDLTFSKTTQISDAAPQQDNFLWGTAELVKWTSLDGRKLEGTLHKPADFDPSKKYPLIVNFYEKSSQSLLSYRMPELHRSTIGYHYYTSNGYLVFNPDVYYKEGYPGEDAFNCVMPGITALIEKGFIDEEHIGAQGHSWGGYQVAYLATRTNLFAAIESGAPVVNMFSAYGGIRWGSGLNRSFQYEHTQSRIGKNIWESPLRYLENSPLFTLDKVNTPILIMHNDDDGAVPWYQGIEYFIGLRRLQKPAWLLNYNDADHWPTKLRDKEDFQKRLAQFFDHYLKGKPMPKWMKDGIPATEKGIEMGYELED